MLLGYLIELDYLSSDHFRKLSWHVFKLTFKIFWTVIGISVAIRASDSSSWLFNAIESSVFSVLFPITFITVMIEFSYHDNLFTRVLATKLPSLIKNNLKMSALAHPIIVTAMFDYIGKIPIELDSPFFYLKASSLFIIFSIITFAFSSILLIIIERPLIRFNKYVASLF